MSPELIGKHAEQDALVFASGYTAKKYHAEIMRFIERRRDLVVIGVNNMTHLCIPHYHMWTNTKRLLRFHECIVPVSALLLGSHLQQEALDVLPSANERHRIDYTDFGLWYGLHKGVIRGRFRTAGTLAVMVAKLMGCGKMYLAGFDGYSKPQDGNQHCWGEGLTDSEDMREEQHKDTEVRRCLSHLKEIGTNLAIITPTMYTEHYEGGLLCEAQS